MKSIVVSEIRKLLGGQIIIGKEDWEVQDAIYYKRHDHKRRNSLLFVNRTDPIDWKAIDQKGPSLVVTDKKEIDLPRLNKTTVLQVQSLVQSYWKFITYYRNLFDIPVVTITGTCGKTTTKDMIHHILSEDRVVHASVSSQNEPRRSFPYLMGIDEQTEAAIFEHGLGNSGNIAHQCMIYQPTIGIITNIGVHHLDGCVDIEGYRKAKSEIIDGVRKGGTLILNSNDENIQKLNKRHFEGKIVYFGTDRDSDFRAANIRYAEGGMAFTMYHQKKGYRVFIPGYGEHQVLNALSALAAVNEMGINLHKAIRRLQSYKNMGRHLEFSKGVGGCTVIDDTWTNNPTSIEAALRVLDAIGKNKKVILILGDINRLGNFEQKYHQEIGSKIAQRNIHALLTIGKKARQIAKQASADGSNAIIRIYQDVNGVEEFLYPQLDEKTIVLIKGPMSSRSLIEFAERLKNGTLARE
ncbi:UDP-N-acetylmuramoyl-tripeptide--D-alanyl-D-alanine ligase [Sporosarcina sp. USHLN248]|uniref:UDP-N-acetylmuramoyl-tripeptide--D-alanyl-D- alanine ligase n=1 Tax=Sporosarcina sp. USHLN248 TaxID=3081300 RepID=UPI0030164C27